MSFWDEEIKIGDISVPRFMAAPLDGITDSPMRQLIRRFSPEELLFTEMRHVACVVNSKSDHSLRYKQEEKVLGFQFSANSERFIPEAVEKVIECGFDMINLNLGCPAKNVIKSGSGSALMADLFRLERLMKLFVKSIDGRVPFTVKIRAGFKEKNAVEVAKLAEDCGSELLIIHPRTQPQAFTGLPDHALVREVKEATSVPVIMSGNINSFKRAQKVYDQTGVDGFMIGRALWGCPWKMKEIRAASKGEEFSMDLVEVIKLAREHLKLSLEHYGPNGFHPFKKHVPIYIKSLVNAGDYRKRLVNCRQSEVMDAVLVEALATASMPSIIPPKPPTSQPQI